jgi:hypothetical protein
MAGLFQSRRPGREAGLPHRCGRVATDLASARLACSVLRATTHVRRRSDTSRARRPQRPWIDAVEDAEHGLDRREHAVQVEAVEADTRRRRQRRVVGVQPLDELDDDGVAPHPGREALEVGERCGGVGIVAEAADVAVDAVRVGPVGRDRVEATLGDQPPPQCRALAIEVVAAVRRFADQREARVGEQPTRPSSSAADAPSATAWRRTAASAGSGKRSGSGHTAKRVACRRVRSGKRRSLPRGPTAQPISA